MLEDAVVLSIPRLRTMLAGDLEAAERGDPAMTSPSEAWLCYPGIKAIAVYRFAHELHLGQARVLARMLAEMGTSERASIFIRAPRSGLDASSTMAPGW